MIYHIFYACQIASLDSINSSCQLLSANFNIVPAYQLADLCRCRYRDQAGLTYQKMQSQLIVFKSTRWNNAKPTIATPRLLVTLVIRKTV